MRDAAIDESTAQRYFTVEEANDCLPRLSDRLREMQRHRETLALLEDEIEPIIARAGLNSGGRAGSDFALALHRFANLASEIQGEGIILRDIDSGLVDFPAWRIDREIHLCWQLGEPAVEHWHEIGAGFAGRKRLGEASEDDFDAADMKI